MPGGSSVPFLEVSIVNTTVERGSFFDVRAERFSPNLTVKELNGFLFRRLVCGHSPKPGAFVYLTNWIGFQFNTLVRKTGVPSPYIGRVEIPKSTVMRIQNATFADEGQIFFCALSLQYQTQNKLIYIFKTKTLKTVYGEFSLFILLSFDLIN